MDITSDPGVGSFCNIFHPEKEKKGEQWCHFDCIDQCLRCHPCCCCLYGVRNPVSGNNSSSSTSSGGFKLQNGKDAQKLNSQFSKLTSGSSCESKSSSRYLLYH
jgi:hypothetical protein